MQNPPRPIMPALLLRIAWTALTAGSVRAFYDGIAPFYEAVFYRHLVHIQKAVTLLTDLQAGLSERRVLDLGCGTGLLARALANAGFTVTGLDVSAVSLEILRRREARVRVVPGDARSLPFADGSFDAVVSMGAWRHFEEPKVVLREVSRVLTDRGMFIVGYFPARLGGVLPVTEGAWNRLLAGLYRQGVSVLGYRDEVGRTFERETGELVGERFCDVRRMESGNGAYLLLARTPRARSVPESLGAEGLVAGSRVSDAGSRVTGGQIR